jgi:hypothetical protein
MGEPSVVPFQRALRIYNGVIHDLTSNCAILLWHVLWSGSINLSCAAFCGFRRRRFCGRSLFPPMYKRAAPLQIFLALVGCLAGMASWYQSTGLLWLLGSLLLIFTVAEPFDGKEATMGNGTMIGFNLGSSSEVERQYKKALEIGGTDEGEPAVRSGRFSAYVRDLDKNKICLFE